MSTAVARPAATASKLGANRLEGMFWTSSGSDQGVMVASRAGLTPLASTRSRMHRPSTTTRSARCRQNRSSFEKIQCAKDPRLMTPAARGTSGYRSMVQNTNRVPFIHRSTMPTSAMKGGVVRQTTTSWRGSVMALKRHATLNAKKS